jgi:hypothetical protein
MPPCLPMLPGHQGHVATWPWSPATCRQRRATATRVSSWPWSGRAAPRARMALLTLWPPARSGCCLLLLWQEVAFELNLALNSSAAEQRERGMGLLVQLVHLDKVGACWAAGVRCAVVVLRALNVPVDAKEWVRAVCQRCDGVLSQPPAYHQVPPLTVCLITAATLNTAHSRRPHL